MHGKLEQLAAHEDLAREALEGLRQQAHAPVHVIGVKGPAWDNCHTQVDATTAHERRNHGYHMEWAESGSSTHYRHTQDNGQHLTNT